MTDIPTIIMLVQAVAMAALMAFCLGLLSRWTGNTTVQEAVMGGLFGLATVVAMSAPIELDDGVIVDLRNLFIGVSAGFFGWIGGAATLGVAVGMRLGIGGGGALLGIAAMVFAASLGLLWRAYVAPRLPGVVWPGLALGAMISLTCGMFLLLPHPMGLMVLTTHGPTLVMLYGLGALLLTALLTREYRLLREAEALAMAAQTDPLTNLPNRRRTEDVFSRLAGRTPAKPGVAMLYFDIDQFKAINDRYGHMVGDAVLRAVTERVNVCLRSGDHLARHGGDEFVVLQTGLTQEDALATAERCRSSVADTPVVCKGQSVSVTISIGLNWSKETIPFADLFRGADEALYRAKAEGRNRISQLPLVA